jgi:hypothetical protein
MLKTDVANRALGRLGVSATISDLDGDRTNAGRIIRREYEMALQEMLEKHHWKFARATAELVLKEENPDRVWGYSYFQPANCQVVRQVAESGRFINNVEQYIDSPNQYLEIYDDSVKLLYTNVKNAHAEYTRRIDQNDIMPRHFGDGLAALLSYRIAPALITNNFPKVRETLNAEAMNDVHGAIADDLNRQPQALWQESSLVRIRRN